MDVREKFDKKIRTVKAEDLLHVYNKYNTLLTLCINAKERAVADKTDKYLRGLGLDIVGKKKKQREDSIKEYFDRVQKDLEDNTILNLVATFEKLIFNDIPTAINNSKELLNANYRNQDPFSSSIKSFVKDTQDINAVSAIQGILLGNISTSLGNNLKEIIDYRNRIAHGKRFGKESQITVSETLERLDEVLEVVV